VEYSVSGAAAPVAVSFKFYDGETVLSPSDANELKGDTAYARNGINAVTFDPKRFFALSDAQRFPNFRVQVLLGDESANMSDRLYRIIDLDTGKIRDLIRADFYNNNGYGAFETDFSKFGEGWNTSLSDVFIWTGVTNNPLYKTSKIVMRYIPAKNITWTMGNNDVSYASPAHQVTLTSDYWLSVFEITQSQLHKLTGLYGYNDTDDAGHETMPANGRWDTCWGRRNTWPSSDGRHDTGIPDNDCFLGKLRKKTGGGILFDFPTEAQWEFACRAGTATKFYNGLDAGSSSLGYRMGTGSGASSPSEVGRFKPNAFGLYDMYSNASEWCLDWYASYTAAAASDPEGPASGNDNKHRVSRGCSYNTAYDTKQNATVYRNGVTPVANSSLAGCRLWCPAE
jgi:formylglycine-generating enzyme required for sulfatase activity